MLKIISIAIGLLSVISIAPKSEATISNSQPISLQQPAGDLYSQVILVGDRRGYSRRYGERRRDGEYRQRGSERRQYRNYRGQRRYGEYRRDGEYRRNR